MPAPPPAPARPDPSLPSPRSRVRAAAAAGLLLFLLALVFLVPQRPSPPPSPEQPDTVVVDKAGLLTPGFARDTGAWLHALQAFEAVLYIDPLPPDTALPAWTTQTVMQWGVGKAHQDRGLALFVFHEARLARIEVGYGLEGRLPDVWLRQMLQTKLVPRFAQGQFEAGIESAIQALQQRVEADGAAAAAAPRASAWSRTWADAWDHGGRLLPALARHFHQSGPFERLGMLAFALPLLLFGVASAAAAVATVHMLLALPRRLRALRGGDPPAAAAHAEALPELLRGADPRWAAVMLLVPVVLGAFLTAMCAAIAVFVFSMAPDHLTRQGRYGGGGVTVTWPAPGLR
jgi:uncharacterized membrane protein YgcG